VIEGASSLVAFDSLGARLSLERVISEENPLGPDLALLKFQVKDVSFLKVRDVRNSDDIAEGDKVIVIGNPAGLTGTVSDGIVSGFRKNRLYVPLIQITAPISPGSSGSPVLDENGEVIGVATLTSNQGQNLNFAIASREIFLLVLGWVDKHPGAAEMLGNIMYAVRGAEDMTVTQYEKAQPIIEKYLADRSAATNDPTYSLAASIAGPYSDAERPLHSSSLSLPYRSTKALSRRLLGLVLLGQYLIFSEAKSGMPIGDALCANATIGGAPA
jgi:Trypsin-like peptidase domain